LRRAEAAAWGAKQPTRQFARSVAAQFRILGWRPYRNPAGTIRGYIDVQLLSGLIINGCKLMLGPNGKRWLAMPSEKATNKDGPPKLNSAGKQVWARPVEFVDKATGDKFRDQVIEALRREHPGALDDGGAAL
jgi:hypothetical protein